MITFVRSWLAANRIPALLVLVQLIGAVGYSAIIPLFEASDENNHFFFARQLALTGRFPNVRFEEGPWGQQATQGPLFYLTAALPIALIDTREAEELVAYFNVSVNLGDGSRPGNKNAWVHDPEREGWPWRNAVLAAHLGRLVSVFYGAMTVWFVYQLVRSLAPRAAGAAGLMVALLPQFLWESGAMTNDVTIAATSALALWLLVASPRPWSTWRLVGLGIALGLAALSKTPGLFLSAYVIGVVAIEGLRAGWQTALTRAGVVVLAAGVVAGPWLAMNWLRYNDPTGVSAHLTVLGNGEATFITRLQDFLAVDWFRMIPAYTTAAFTSFWGVFGLHNILAPSEVYEGLNWLAFLGFAGFGLSLIWPVSGVRNHRRWCGILLGWLGLHLITLAYWASRSGGGPGRLLFPSLPVIALACAVGWLRWAEWLRIKSLTSALSGLLPGLLGVFAVAAPIWLILPAYALPPAVADLPQTATPVHAFYGDLELVGIEAQKVVKEGELFQTTFYWRLKQATEREYIVFPRLLDYRLTPVAGTNTYPGWGNWPVSLWEPGRIYADTYRLPVAADATRPGLGRVLLAVEIDHVWQQPRGEDGTLLDPAMPLAGVGFAPVASTLKTYEPLATFGESVTLVHVAYTPSVARGESIQLDLGWQARRAMAEGWKRFVHLDDGNRAQPKLLAQEDSIPAHGFGLPWWELEEVVPDQAVLSLGPDVPPGEYALWVGFAAPSGIRVPIVGGDHQDGRLYLGTIKIR